MSTGTTNAYEDRFGAVIDHADADYVEIRWYDTTEAMSAGEFQDWLSGFAGEVERCRRAGVLVDGTSFLMDPANMDSQWRDEHIVPRYNAAGVRGFAFHMPDGMPAIGTPPAPEGPATFPTAYFGRRQDALDWLGSTDGASAATSKPKARFPAPTEGILITQLIISADVERSRRFYTDVLGGEALLEGDFSIVALANGWVTITVAGGPTEDKPSVTLEPPSHPDRVSSFLNIRVADIGAVYEEWSARGAEFLTPPIDRGGEIRCYMRDPDGYLIEVGQLVGRPDA